MASYLCLKCGHQWDEEGLLIPPVCYGLDLRHEPTIMLRKRDEPVHPDEAEKVRGFPI